MPHVSSGGGDDLASSDEIRVYDDEGDEEKRSSENLLEDKFGLVNESEATKSTDVRENGAKPTAYDDARIFSHLFPRPLFSYPFFSPYSYTNGAALPGAGGKVLPPSANPFLPLYGSGDLAQPPPAHMGISAVPFDAKRSLLTSPLLACTTPPLPYPPLYPPDFSSWPTPPGYPPLPGGPFPNPFATSLSGFSSSLLNMAPPGVSHPTLVAQTGGREPLSPVSGLDPRHALCERRATPPSKKRPYVKKPLNAFMLFMKEQRQKVIDESTLKESAAINQILGRKWHELSRAEQTRYYEMARKEKELHLKSNPNWSARDNYGLHSKRKKKREITCQQNASDKDSPSAKKCRAYFGLDQQSQWCKPCRRKKRCIRFKHGDGEAGSDEENNNDDIDADATTDERSRSVHTRGSTTDGDNRALSPLSFADENSSGPPSLALQQSFLNSRDTNSSSPQLSAFSRHHPAGKFPSFDGAGGIPSLHLPSLQDPPNRALSNTPTPNGFQIASVGCVT